ncbi:MAG: hypothetical protein RPV21_16045 [Candidatus Sedimenticola sp. (ex Thyasira tokunagai)]
MSKTISIKPGTEVVIANLITMTFEQGNGDEIIMTFNAPEGIETDTDLDGTVQVNTKSLTFTLGNDFHTTEHTTIGELICNILDNIQDSPSHPLTVLTNVAKVPSSDG